MRERTHDYKSSPTSPPSLYEIAIHPSIISEAISYALITAIYVAIGIVSDVRASSDRPWRVYRGESECVIIYRASDAAERASLRYIVVGGTALEIFDNKFSGNTTNYDGGGLYLGSRELTMSDNEFYNNSSK